MADPTWRVGRFSRAPDRDIYIERLWAGHRRRVVAYAIWREPADVHAYEHWLKSDPAEMVPKPPPTLTLRQAEVDALVVEALRGEQGSPGPTGPVGPPADAS